MSTSDGKKGKDPPRTKGKRETDSDLTHGEGATGTSQAHSAVPAAPFSGQGRTGDSQSPATPKVKRQSTAAKLKGAVGPGKSKQAKSQNQPVTKTLKVSMPAIKGKMGKKSQKQTTQESLEEESSDGSPIEPEIDPQTQPLPADPSDDEMTGSVDRPPQTESVPTDMQRYREDVDSGDDIQITHIPPRKTSKLTGPSQPISILTSDGKVLEGQLTPAYLVQRTVGDSPTTTTPTGFKTIQGVHRVRPEIGVTTQTEKPPVEGSVHVYPGKIVDKTVVTTKAEVYAVPTTSQARPITQAETGLLGAAALATGPTQLAEKSETAMVTDSFSSISVSDRETPTRVDGESLTTQYVELSSDPEVAARPLQGGKASLDGAMADSSGSELGDTVDPLNMEGLEEGEVPPSPAQRDESMDVSAEDGKNSERDENSRSEQENWQQKPGLDEKGHDPSQSWLGRSEDEGKSDAAEARRQEKEEGRAEEGT